MTNPWLTIALLVVVSLSGCTPSVRASHIVLATTTSVGNSGLLDVILPAWQHETGVDVRVALAGSGRALGMMENGHADLVLSHAPAAEADALARNPHWQYRKLMFTDFVIVGPPDDPSRVRTASTAAEAMRHIAANRGSFVSRADESGTHEREQALWRLAGTQPSPERLIASGAGMATTLRQADERAAYTLVDRPTFEQLQDRLDLRIVADGGVELLNSYAVLTPGPQAAHDARRFAEWMSDGNGRARIAGFRVVGGHPAYRVWPAGRPRDRPDALPF